MRINQAFKPLIKINLVFLQRVSSETQDTLKKKKRYAHLEVGNVGNSRLNPERLHSGSHA